MSEKRATTPSVIRQPRAAPQASGWQRFLLLLAGWSAFLLGLVGVLLPLLPTAPFLVVAVLCFSRSDPAMLERLFRMPVVGSYLRDWQEGRGVSRGLKWTAIAALWMTAFWLMLVVAKTVAWKFLVLLLAVATTLHLLLMPAAHPRPARPMPANRHKSA